MEMFSLDRFLAAQENVYARALEEITNGRKESHWMWYIFPQLRGLGKSQMAYIYGINGRKEAKAYLAHPILSSRLAEISEALLTHKGKNIENIMGGIDAMKLHSSMTLFAFFSNKDSVFHKILDAFYGGEDDERTVGMLK